MFRLWAKTFKDSKLQRDIVIEDSSDDTRTHKIMHALEQVCVKFDLQVPVWLESNIADFKRVSKTRFDQDSFIENIPFDYLEISVIEEDPKY